jgi:hypothetical protein
LISAASGERQKKCRKEGSATLKFKNWLCLKICVLLLAALLRDSGTGCSLFKYHLQLKLFNSLKPLLGGAQKFRNRFGSFLVLLDFESLLCASFASS